MALESPIALSARGYLPETWDSLANSSFYGESLLDIKQKFVKFALFGTVVNVGDEDVVYNPLVIEYASMALAITIIPAGADYYSGKAISITATGTNENKTYPDRIGNLWKLYANLLRSMQELLPQVQKYFPGSGIKNVKSIPSNTGANSPYLSTDPRVYWPEALYATTSNNLPWTAWA